MFTRRKATATTATVDGLQPKTAEGDASLTVLEPPVFASVETIAEPAVIPASASTPHVPPDLHQPQPSVERAPTPPRQSSTGESPPLTDSLQALASLAAADRRPRTDSPTVALHRSKRSAAGAAPATDQHRTTEPIGKAPDARPALLPPDLPPLVLRRAQGTWSSGGQAGSAPTCPEKATASTREEVASLSRSAEFTTVAQTSSSVSNERTANASLRNNAPGGHSSSTAARQQKADFNTAPPSSIARVPTVNTSGTTHTTSGRAGGTPLYERGEQSNRPSNLPRTTAAQSAKVPTLITRFSTQSAASSEVTRWPEDVTVPLASSSMTLSRSSEVLNNTNTTSTKFPNVLTAGHEASLENSSTSLMSNEFGTNKTDSLTTNVPASTKDAATSTSADAPRSRRNKGAIFATVIGAAVLLMGIIVMGLWFYNVRWKLNRDRPLLRHATAPDTTPIPFSVVYYQNDGTQSAGLRRN
ncbi:mucin-5AC-like [Dermacentor silvarum]|uniref:mucin-5AC-like n=1 Tax=Dermacentor silvarum TaxID=543639 RepID=UPI0018975BF1|nr:mucin-5AC-like [Dermacentor silvarum]